MGWYQSSLIHAIEESQPRFITLIHLGDFVGALMRFYQALLLSTYHSPFHSSRNVSDQIVKENIPSSCDIDDNFKDDAISSIQSDRATTSLRKEPSNFRNEDKGFLISK